LKELVFDGFTGNTQAAKEILSTSLPGVARHCSVDSELGDCWIFGSFFMIKFEV
jgi:hypothetical protein